MSTGVRAGPTDLTDVESRLVLSEDVELDQHIFELAAADVLVHEKKVVLIFGDLVQGHDEGEVWSVPPM